MHVQYSYFSKRNKTRKCKYEPPTTTTNTGMILFLVENESRVSLLVLFPVGTGQYRSLYVFRTLYCQSINQSEYFSHRVQYHHHTQLQ
mmetsp:Transcript_17077/g.19525  ORF Transcript_17077/g.19525 Transcript_17077/m.19525 type:complete len:88 (-) Transcript_17077:45-308(-)